jgi:hypothetical protein
MKKGGLFILLGVMSAVLATCTDKSSNPGGQQIYANLRQIGGCVSSALHKSAASDSSFGYQFGDTLFVDFLLTGNCCPDSNRFALSYEVRGDTLLVAATDTAGNLCYCVCDYIVRAEFRNLPLDHYVFVCSRTDDSGKVYYREIVSRN